MDFAWSEDQIQRMEAMAELGSELNADLATADREGRFDQGKWQRVAEAGLLGSFVPRRWGGLGLDPLTAVAMLEGFGYGCRDNGLNLAVNGQMWAVEEPILRFGTDEQREQYLPGLISGDLIGAHAMTEPESGSDTFSLSTTAQATGDGFVLNGSKTLIGMAPVSDLALVYAKTAPERGRWGVSAFIVDTDAPGVSKTGPFEKMGLRTAPLGGFAFEDCFLPESSLLGPLGAGASIFAESMEWERSFVGASYLGAMARQLDETVEYAKTRRQFDQPIGKFQSVSNRVADMRLRLEASRLLLYRCAWMKSHGDAAGVESALANLQVAESFVANSLDAIRVNGGRGYLSEFEVERDLRDAVGGIIYSGTSDIQRGIVAGLMGL